jgi:CheY-like chemotaxis protein
MKEHTSILVVDDNEDLLFTLALILRRRGFYVETAYDGLTAVNKFRKGNFDVTLMDILLPEMNGVEALRCIRKIDPQARVILMTAYSDESLMELALQTGVYGVLHKPLRIDQTIEMIQDSEPMSCG